MKFSFRLTYCFCIFTFLALSGCSPQDIKQTTLSVWRKQRGTEKKQAVPTRLEWRSRPEVPKAGLPALWSLKVLDLRTDPLEPKGIRAYDAPHGVAMHLFIIARDGSQYAHLYPEHRDYGTFRIRPVIPQAGAYQLWADFTPIDGYAVAHSQKFLVSGDVTPKARPWKPDKARDGLLETRVQAREEQSFAPKADARSYIVQMQDIEWQVGQTVEVRTWLWDEKRKPITDLQVHLSGAAYGVAFSQDGGQLVRLEALKREKNSHETEFSVSFPEPGLYQIWLEFRRADKIIVAPFVVRVFAKAAK